MAGTRITAVVEVKKTQQILNAMVFSIKCYNVESSEILTFSRNQGTVA